MERIFAFLDVESTGLQRQPLSSLCEAAPIFSHGDEVCQIGGIITDSMMRPSKFFCHYCDTVRADSPAQAQSVHGISQRDVRRYALGQFLPEIITRYLPELLEENVIFVGYNVEFDMGEIAQTCANSPINFEWSPLKGNIVPRRGRHSVDVAEFVKTTKGYVKLTSFEKELETPRMQFLNLWERRLSVQTNCIELLQDTWEQAHNSFFDALNTYILWGEKVWKKKLV